MREFIMQELSNTAWSSAMTTQSDEQLFADIDNRRTIRLSVCLSSCLSLPRRSAQSSGVRHLQAVDSFSACLSSACLSVYLCSSRAREQVSSGSRLRCLLHRRLWHRQTDTLTHFPFPWGFLFLPRLVAAKMHTILLLLHASLGSTPASIPWRIPLLRPLVTRRCTQQSPINIGATGNRFTLGVGSTAPRVVCLVL